MIRWFKKRATPAPAPAPVVAPGYEACARLAAQHLPPEDAQRWLALLRPALALAPARPGEPVVARLGGAPRLPADTPWPEWPGTGPLAYIGEVRCGAVDQSRLDIALPASGRLLFFYFDGSYDDGVEIVIYSEPETAAGARVVYVPDGAAVVERQAPEGVQVYAEGGYAGHPMFTAPGWDHPLVSAAFPDVRDDHPVSADAFVDALDALSAGLRHQLGGHAVPVQGPVEWEVAGFALGEGQEAAAYEAEAEQWTLLLQVDSDDDLGMMWGDAGMLYWLARRDRLDGTPPTDALFTWQCA
jgi:hypothetical protein